MRPLTAARLSLPRLTCAVLVFVAMSLLPSFSWAQVTLGVSLPVPLDEITTLTQGGPPNFADTFVTPFVAASGGNVFTWKAQFIPGALEGGNCGIPVGIQLKALRQTSSTELTVVGEGAVHNPLSTFGGTCPSFLIGSAGSVLEFQDFGLAFAPGDIVGLTILSDSAPEDSPGYFYPLVGADGDTRVVLRNVDVNETIDLASPFTGTHRSLTPALFVSLGISLTIDIKPGSEENTINLGSAGVVPVAMLSTPTFDAMTIDPDTLFLAGAPVGMVGKSGKFQCHQQDVNQDGLNDLVCQFDTAQFLIQPGDTTAEVVGKTRAGLSARGQDRIRIVPD